jgi:hypothetical protein
LFGEFGWSRQNVDALGGEHRVEWCGALGVADEESELGDSVVEDVDASSVDLHDEEGVEPA